MSKRDVILSYLNTGSVVRLYVDPRPADVIVPPWLKQQEWLCLDIGLALPKPIADLYVGVMTVYGTLSFGGCGFACTLPYSAVHAARHLTSGEIMSWRANATAKILDDGAAGRAPVVKPSPMQADAKVVNLADWRRSRGR